MDSVFRPGNEDRKKKALMLNRAAQKKLETMRKQIIDGYKSITP